MVVRDSTESLVVGELLEMSSQRSYRPQVNTPITHSRLNLRCGGNKPVSESSTMTISGGSRISRRGWGVDPVGGAKV